VNEPVAPERYGWTAAIKAQSVAISRDMASICNTERGRQGASSGREGFVHGFCGEEGGHVAVVRQRRRVPMPAHRLLLGGGVQREPSAALHVIDRVQPICRSRPGTAGRPPPRGHIGAASRPTLQATDRVPQASKNTASGVIGRLYSIHRVALIPRSDRHLCAASA
jgi:hypothetical protein